jgi:hypothetical protein
MLFLTSMSTCVSIIDAFVCTTVVTDLFTVVAAVRPKLYQKCTAELNDVRAELLQSVSDWCYHVSATCHLELQ